MCGGRKMNKIELDKMVKTYFEDWEIEINKLDFDTLKLFLNAMTCCETTRDKIEELIKKQLEKLEAMDSEVKD